MSRARLPPATSSTVLAPRTPIPAPGSPTSRAALGALIPPGLSPLAVLGPVSPDFAGLERPWTYRIVGRDEIDGQPAVELETRWPRSDVAVMRARGLPAKVVRDVATARFDVWISEASYLPVRERRYDG